LSRPRATATNSGTLRERAVDGGVVARDYDGSEFRVSVANLGPDTKLRLDVQEVTAPIEVHRTDFNAATWAHALRSALRFRRAAEFYSHEKLSLWSADGIGTHTPFRLLYKENGTRGVHSIKGIVAGAHRRDSGWISNGTKRIDTPSFTYSPYYTAKLSSRNLTGGSIGETARPWVQLANLWVSDPSLSAAESKRTPNATPRVDIVALGAFPFRPPPADGLDESVADRYRAKITITNTRMKADSLPEATVVLHQTATGSGRVTIPGYAGDRLHITVEHEGVPDFSGEAKFSTLIRVPHPSGGPPRFTRATHVDGMLLQVPTRDRDPNPVYLVDGGARYAVPRSEFARLGVSANEISEVDKSTLATLPESDWDEFSAASR
jgi:hypothetical protein